MVDRLGFIDTVEVREVRVDDRAVRVQRDGTFAVAGSNGGPQAEVRAGEVKTYRVTEPA